ncbi:MAG: tryptophan synthase subunit beta [Spirochaetaceae bacterium]|nr:tryptophan synthase subunit beta [Spirochaetaceae bacterium]
MKVYNDYFGQFGGRYAAEVLRTPLDELQAAFTEAVVDPEFLAELDRFGRQFAGRPTPLSPAVNAQAEIGGASIYLKLEGLANTGAHKVNNVIGQCLLARRMGKPRVIAETGAGQHGVATAAVAAKLGLECRVYMGEVDVRRQRPNVFWMELFGAEVVPVGSGSRTLKDAINEALRDWSDTFDRTHYVIGSVMGPSPYPDMVREFQSVVGREVSEQCRQLGVQPTALIACVGGGSNALGFFAPHLEASAPRLIGVEAGGRGPARGDHAARMSGSGIPGIVHGYKSLFLTDGDGQVAETHSISAGLDYPGVGPQLAHLGTSGRVEFTTASDDEALDAVRLFARTEGIIFALESAHAGAAAIKVARALPDDASVVVNVSGRGDKDLFILAGALQPERWAEFLTREAQEIAHG